MGLDVEIAGDFDGIVELVVVAVGALSESLVAAADVAVGGAGTTVVELDYVADVREFAIGFDVVVFDGFGERDILNGAVSHDEEEGLFADGLAEAGQKQVGWFAGEAEIGKLFEVGFGDIKMGIKLFDAVPVKGEGG